MRTWTQPDPATTKAERRLAYVYERLEALLEDLPHLRRMAEGAEEASHLRGRRHVDLDDPGIRGEGSPPGDPVWDTVSDPARLGVASVAATADRHLIRAISHLEIARSLLTRGLDRWDGRK